MLSAFNIGAWTSGHCLPGQDLDDGGVEVAGFHVAAGRRPIRRRSPGSHENGLQAGRPVEAAVRIVGDEPAAVGRLGRDA
jgi:hypothetical protein